MHTHKNNTLKHISIHMIPAHSPTYDTNFTHPMCTHANTSPHLKCLHFMQQSASKNTHTHTHTHTHAQTHTHTHTQTHTQTRGHTLSHTLNCQTHLMTCVISLASPPLWRICH